MNPTHPNQMPSLVYANNQGEIKEFPELAMAGRSGTLIQKPKLTDLIPLPEGSELFILPNRFPVGINPVDNEPARLVENPESPNEGIQAVAAFVSPAYTANHLVAFDKDGSNPKPLPLFAYATVGWYDGKFWVSCFRSDTSTRQDISNFNPDKIRIQTARVLKNNPNNRLIQHLGNCCLTYRCPAAQNFFLGREEAPLPTSPSCNAACVGCISLQPSGCCPSTQERIKFIPTPDEIAAVAIPHLQRVDNSVVSFGQGCEGEPLLQAPIIEKAIIKIRRKTSKGTINCNSNGSLPAEVARLADAGLDSIRVSINSARKSVHTLYYRPKGFCFDDVCQSITIMKERGKFVSLNYFIFPGVTDDPNEFDAFCHLIRHYQPNFIQLRNLNMDPDWYIATIKHTTEHQPMGIQTWLKKITTEFPALQFGYFNPVIRQQS